MPMITELVQTPAENGEHSVRPEMFRLPKPGQRDPHFGLPRTTYYDLEKTGAIRFVRLRKRGLTRGTTLIPFDQMLAYLRGLLPKGGASV